MHRGVNWGAWFQQLSRDPTVATVSGKVGKIWYREVVRHIE